MGFEQARQDQLPKWLRGDGETLSAVVGREQEAELVRLKEAEKARFPLPIGPADALPSQFVERGMFRCPVETDEEAGQRLLRAALYWYWAGTKPGMVQIFEPYPLYVSAPAERWFNVTHDESRELDVERAPATSPFVHVFNEYEGPIGPEDHHYSRFVIEVDSTEALAWDNDAPWDSEGAWDDGGLWDTTMTVADVRYLLLQIRRWKAVDSYPVFVAVWLPDNPSDGFWVSRGVYDDGGLWGDEITSDPVIITVGHVWQEEAGLGGWLGAAEPVLTDTWSDDDTTVWEGFVEPLQFGVS